MTNQTVAWIYGATAGAGAMFLLDPARGRRRRATIYEKAKHVAHKAVDAAGTTGRDLRHRAAGAVARARAAMRSDHPSDDVLVARVRAALGRVVSHPGAIAVGARDGVITLDGPVLKHEADALIAAVRHVRGVHAVESRLSVHEHAQNVPGLQGGGTRRGKSSPFMRETWSPTARLFACAAGTALIAQGLRQSKPAGVALVGGGAMLVTRALTNAGTRRLLGLSGRRSVDIQKTVHIAAPVQDVFRLWQDYEHFPRFMSHVRHVQDLGGGRSRWTVAGPGGAPVTWDAEVTKIVPDRLIAWKSIGGAVVAHAGIVRFDPTPSGTTRVTIRLSYNPPGGMVGHGIAWLFGADPKHQLDDDLVRLKTLVKTGKAPRDAAQPGGPPLYHTASGAAR